MTTRGVGGNGWFKCYVILRGLMRERRGEKNLSWNPEADSPKLDSACEKSLCSLTQQMQKKRFNREGSHDVARFS